MEEEIGYRGENDVTTPDLRSQIEMEVEIQFSKVIEETDLKVDENDVKTCNLRDLETLKRKGKTYRKLKEENDTLREALFKMEDKHRADIRQHIQEEEKCKKNIYNLKKEQDDARTKAGRHTQELNKASARMKEQEVLFSVEKSWLEEKVEYLKYQLKLNSARYMTDDNNKEQLDQNHEEILRLKKVVYSLKERCIFDKEIIKSLKSEKDDLKIENNHLKDQIRQLQEHWDRLKTDEVTQQESTRNETTNLQRQKVKLEQENQELRNQLHSLENKISEQDRRFKNTESDELKNHQRSKSELDSLRRLYDTLVTDYKILKANQKENITSQGAITNLQNNIRKLSEELKESKKSVTNSTAEKIVSERTIKQLQTSLRNLFEEQNDFKTRFLSVTDKLQGAEQKVIDLIKNIDDQNQDKETASAKLDKLEKENEYLVNQLRSNEIKIELLNTSHETERKKHESAMKSMHACCSENEIELEKHKNAHFNLLLQLDRVHNNSRISMEDTALFDKTFIEQKLEDEKAKEEDLAEVTTKVIKKFASAKDRHGVIKSFQKRIEKGSCPSPFGKDFLSDEDLHMECFPNAIHEHRDNKKCNDRLEENKTTRNCHNKTEKNTNVFNINMNIAKSNVSFIDKKEERTLRLNDGRSDHKAIEGTEKF